jgi:hypothetical protein
VAALQRLPVSRRAFIVHGYEGSRIRARRTMRRWSGRRSPTGPDETGPGETGHGKEGQTLRLVEPGAHPAAVTI